MAMYAWCMCVWLCMYGGARCINGYICKACMAMYVWLCMFSYVSMAMHVCLYMYGYVRMAMYV